MLSKGLVDHAIEKVIKMRIARAIKTPRVHECKICGSKIYVRRSGMPLTCSNRQCLKSSFNKQQKAA